jgi:hypothetical protein
VLFVGFVHCFPCFCLHGVRKNHSASTTMNFLFFSLKIICRDEILFASQYTPRVKNFQSPDDTMNYRVITGNSINGLQSNFNDDEDDAYQEEDDDNIKYLKKHMNIDNDKLDDIVVDNNVNDQDF